MRVQSVRAIFVCAFVAMASSAGAQTVESSDNARFQWGPLRFTPTLQISNVGRDSNVYNDAENPKSDFTAAIGPAVQVWVRPFGSRLSVSTGGQYLYFQTYDDQRAWNTANELRWDVPLARVTPFVGATYVNSRERQGYEVDARSRRRDRSLLVGTEVRLSAKTAVVVSARRFDAEYDEGETYLGADLANALNRREQSGKLQFRYTLTPLTTFVVDSEAGRDRFVNDPIRDSNSLKVMPGFELKPAALISGSVFVGFRRFDPLSTSLPDYSGVIAAVKARYTRSATRYDVVVDRDVAYSFEALQPYYTLLNTGLTVTQRVTRRWDLVGRGSLQRLAYQDLVSAGLPAGPSQSEEQRVDRGRELGGGFGFNMNESVRFGFNVSYVTRKSPLEGTRAFSGTRIFGSISYGMQQ